MNSFVINLLGIIVIVLIVWWFWLSRPEGRRVAGDGTIEVIVDNGVYIPARIEVPAGKPVTLRFFRKDPSPCAEKVIFSGLGLSRDLPLDKPQELTLTPEKSGEFEFTCQMGMYRGRLVVRG